MGSISMKQLLQLVPKSGFYLQRCSTQTWMVERRFPAGLIKPGRFPSLRKKNHVYDVIQQNVSVPVNMPVLLTQYVENVGQPGEVVEIREKLGRYLLLTKQAVYPTPENTEKYGGNREVETFSSRYVKNTIDVLSKFILSVSMNKEVPWTLEPWHIRMSFRKAHIIVPEDAITLPKNQIKGPDLSIQGKEFYITVTINKTEKVTVRCRLNHWTNKLEERVPWVPFFFKQPVEQIFSEDKEIAAQLPPIETLNLDPEEFEEMVAKLQDKNASKAKLLK